MVSSRATRKFGGLLRLLHGRCPSQSFDSGFSRCLILTLFLEGLDLHHSILVLLLCLSASSHVYEKSWWSPSNQPSRTTPGVRPRRVFPGTELEATRCETCSSTV
jgi:hypothetical protein